MGNEELYVDYCRAVIAGLCQFPDDVSVEKSTDDMGVLLVVRTNKADMGSVIGKKGQNAQAVRLLVKAAGAKEKARVSIKIEEPEGSTRTPREY